MKRALVGVTGFLTLVLTTPGEAQIPARGLSALVCLAGINGNGTYEIGESGRLIIVVSGDDGSSATVDVTHGEDSSQHVLTYTDRDRSGTLTCGDIIGTVS